MKYIAVIAVLLGFAFPAFAQTQMDMVKAAQADYFKADKKLNETYQKIQKAYKQDTLFLRDLKRAQVAWIKFRDLQVIMKYPHKTGLGSATPMCRFAYIQKLTEDRTLQLQEWLDGTPEGDVCTGTTLRGR